MPTPSPPNRLPAISIELFGVPRLIAGRPRVIATGLTLGELAVDLLRREPALTAGVLDPATGWPLPGYHFVVDERFTRDPALPLHEGSAVLLVASAAGG